MKQLYSRLIALMAVLGLLFAGPAQAVVRALDNAPAATLLLPYFEVDLTNPNGSQTAFQLDNTSATATLAHVTIWTDLGIPTQTFDVYLVGYDSITVDLRALFLKGVIPVTASAGQDPTNTISPKGPLSQDINFASCTGSLPPALLPSATTAALRAAHTGQASSLFGNLCGASPRSDNIARGYITIDTVNQCSAFTPTSVGYFIAGGSGVATNQNILTGTFRTINRATGAMSGGPLVASEASGTAFVATNQTLYGGYVQGLASDGREPLGAIWNARYMDGGANNSTTNLIVWRDPGRLVSPFACGAALPIPFPLSQREVVAFDEQEQFTDAGNANLFPLATQRVNIGSLTPYNAGVLRLNLNQADGNFRQSYVHVDYQSGGTTFGSAPASALCTVEGSTSTCTDRVNFD